MAEVTEAGLTRRQMLKAGGTAAAAAGYALSVETVLAPAIKTDTQGIVAGDQVVKIGNYNMNVYEARPASGTSHPILLVVSEIWGGCSPRRSEVSSGRRRRRKDSET